MATTKSNTRSRGKEAFTAWIRRLSVSIVMAFLAIAVSRAAPSTVDFENLTDSTILTDQYAALYGVNFANTVIVTLLALSSRTSQNEYESPPHSGANVASDNGGPMTIKFAAPVSSVGGYFTYGEGGTQVFTNLTIQAFDVNNNPVGSAASA